MDVKHYTDFLRKVFYLVVSDIRKMYRLGEMTDITLNAINKLLHSMLVCELCLFLNELAQNRLSKQYHKFYKLKQLISFKKIKVSLHF